MSVNEGAGLVLGEKEYGVLKYRSGEEALERYKSASEEREARGLVVEESRSKSALSDVGGGLEEDEGAEGAGLEVRTSISALPDVGGSLVEGGAGPKANESYSALPDVGGGLVEEGEALEVGGPNVSNEVELEEEREGRSRVDAREQDVEGLVEDGGVHTSGSHVVCQGREVKPKTGTSRPGYPYRRTPPPPKLEPERYIL